MDLDSIIKKAISNKVEESVAIIHAEYNVIVDQVIESLSEFADLGFDGQDIIDTGRLLNSKTIETSGSIDTELVAEWEWDPIDPESGHHYARAVYYGFFAFGRHYVPGRPWARRAMENLNPQSRLRQLLEN